ncbi:MULTISPECIES: NACHT domain-containing protein [Pseudomonas]|uniref:NACHT domain-containing protein n=1 Tax=Pseudomonas TaxID=286 RepID=UPI0009E1C58A|nr:MULTISPECIES: NACHT domain-containing protein [Pseudomonas]
MSGNHRFVLAVLLIVASVVGAAYYASGGAAFFFAVLIAVMVLLLRPLVMPAGYGKNKIRVLCVAGALGLAAAWGGWAGFANDLLVALWSSPQLSATPEWIKSLRMSEQPSPLTLLFVFSVIFVVNYFMREGPIGGGHPVPLDRDFPEESFKHKLEAFCNALLHDLITIDHKSNWSPEYYTELQAEVEILSSNGVTSRRKIVNLQEAIRKDRHARAFLILGVPGAGKSVALRKLARDMFSEVNSSRIPIYINLREWVRSEIEHTNGIQFKVSDLETFVLDSLRRRGDVFTEEFVDNYFRKLWSAGRLFFIFDSFDEMSELLDANEDSEVINALSDVISRFITTHPLSRGVLASRIFRRPTQAFQAQKLLEIRPLSEASISDALSRHPEFDKSLRRKLFTQRTDLIPLARNPFMMALLGTWVKAHRDLPINQPQIFEGYINIRLDTCAPKLGRAAISAERVKSVSVEIAWFVFKSSTFGLEAPVKLIKEHFNSEEIETVLEILDYARIARVTHGEEKSFAFVHRRFLEYFVTAKLLSNPADVPISHIPTDSRGRDALVLYAQLCDETEAVRIAQLCWDEITANFNDPDLRLRAIHCLRFLIDAFGARRSAIAQFEEALSAFVMDHVTNGESLILAKICLEATGLLTESKAAPVLLVAISGQDSWLQETAFRACRQLPKMNSALEESITQYVMNIPDQNYWANRKSLLLSLSLSDALRGVYQTAQWRLHNMRTSIGAALSAIILSPGLAGSMLFYGVIMSLFGAAMQAPLRAQAKRKLKISNSSSRMPALSNWLFGRRFSDHLIPAIRLYGGIALMLTSIISLTHADLIASEGFSCPLSWCDNWRVEYALALAITSVLLLDWSLLGRLAKEFFKSSKLLENAAIAVIVLVLLGVGVAFLRWAERFPIIILAFKYLAFATTSAITAVFFGWLCVSAWKSYKDIKTLKTTPISSTITRGEIAIIFSNLKTPYGQLRFVRILERDRITAVGAWPIEFKLSVGQGEPTCALARLEERWLHLDR